MNEKTLKEIIDGIIEDAFNRINYAYQYHREGIHKNVEPQNGNIITRLVFPKYSDKENQEKSNSHDNHDNSQEVRTRISEQELRFAFVEAFNASDDVKNQKLFYSIETPTKEKYSGFSPSNKEKVKPDFDPDGQS